MYSAKWPSQNACQELINRSFFTEVASGLHSRQVGERTLLFTGYVTIDDDLFLNLAPRPLSKRAQIVFISTYIR